MAKPQKARKMSREEREMQSLQKRLRKKQQPELTQHEDEEWERSSAKKMRFVDSAGERDYYVRDIEADVLFREMKRRDF